MKSYFKILLTSLVLTVAFLQAKEPLSQRQQDLKLILEQGLFSPKAELFLNMLAMEVTMASKKAVEPETLVIQLRTSIEDPKILAKFCEPYKEFTDEEAHELRTIYENAVYQKYNQQGEEIFKAHVDSLTEMLNELASHYSDEKKEMSLGNVLEITKENFQKEIAESTKPIILDFYSDSCPPCRLMEPILNELSDAYKDTIRFGRINCRTESELAQRYGIKTLPTLLFLKPGEEPVVLSQTSGFTPKNEFESKISQFLADLDTPSESRPLR